MIYRVFYPGFTSTLSRDFDNETEAKKFARERENAAGHMWRHVQIKVVEK